MDFDAIFYELSDMNIGEILENEPMYKHTTFKVGGPARLYIKVKDLDALKSILSYCKDHEIKHMVIGKGSDLLFSDKEYEGIIISLSENFNKVEMNGSEIKAQAGVGMIYLAYESAKVGLSGFEFMGGIPGTIGGGVYMNAGAYKYCFADVFKEATILNEKNELITLTADEMEFSYRKSVLQKNKNWVMIDATFSMNVKDPVEIRSVLDKRKEKRMGSQPWNFASAGSIFRNTDEKAAWQYIDEAGLRGYEIGGAQVSPKHSNFIVNNGYASARDILDLILYVEKKVFDEFRVELKKEVILVNWE